MRNYEVVGNGGTRAPRGGKRGIPSRVPGEHHVHRQHEPGSARYDLQCIANAGDDLCSLRAAIEQANALYNLSAEPEVHLTINSGRFVELVGASPSGTIIQPAEGVFSRVFYILGGFFRFSNLTVRNARTDFNTGGGILIEAPSFYGEINNCIIENNGSAF